MKRFFLILLLWELGVGQMAYAQQLLGEKQLLALAPQHQQPAALLRLQADSLRLVGDYYPNGPTSYLQARINRLNLASCDTLAAGPTVLRLSRAVVTPRA